MIYKAALLSSLLVAGATVNHSPAVDADADLEIELDDLEDEPCGEECDTAEFYSDIMSADHSAKIFKTSNAAKKWVKFPEQLSAHVSALEQTKMGRNLREAKSSNTKVVAHDTFFKMHAETLGMSDRIEMRETDQTMMKGTQTIRRRFNQHFNGVKVLSGDYVMFVGAHDGVLHAHGSTLQEASMKQDEQTFREIASAQVDTAAIHAKVKEAILEHVRIKPINQESLSELSARVHPEVRLHAAPVAAKAGGEAAAALSKDDVTLRDDVSFELVVHPEWLGRDVTDSSLAYFVEGTATVGGEMLVFQVSLEAESLATRLFIDKSFRFTPRNVYDHDIFIFPSDDEGETLGPATWATNMPKTTTTGTTVGDMLVDTTVQTANLMYALTGGVYDTWAGGANNLNIVQFTTAYANAYFNGWGIFFGPGFETDDVIAHEWAHGYTDTMNNLIYNSHSGALNEAFSDIIGEAIDILNEDTADTDTMRTPGTCVDDEASNRWAIGEETSYSIFRDMYKPECKINPSHQRHPYFHKYWCFADYDGYGVHSNSGVMNKVFSTMVDGGEQQKMTKSYSVKEKFSSKGIGITRALNLIVNAYADLSSGATFQEAALAIESQCELLKTGTVYNPVIKNKKLKVGGSSFASDRICKKAIKIVKAAYMFEDPPTKEDCTRYCNAFPSDYDCF